mmetsp:Transcript_56858/g.166471  ORF Transcript_56858/g.166471 Transcript_56858/m.166471 type:complete len:211 (+) Transcript_56858:51-683(+)
MLTQMSRVVGLAAVLFGMVASRTLRRGEDTAIQSSESALAELQALADATAVLLQSANATFNRTGSVHVHNGTALKQQQKVLEDLFAHLKTNIAKFNKGESSAKEENQQRIERLQKRLESDQQQLKNSTLSDFEHEMLVNRTREEQNELKYWSRGREIQHGMFHANLKMTHGLMSKVKTVLDAYKEMLAKGKIGGKLAEDLARATSGIRKH